MELDINASKISVEEYIVRTTSYMKINL